MARYARAVTTVAVAVVVVCLWGEGGDLPILGISLTF